jgi:two-component system chemotaxis response regulator CheB
MILIGASLGGLKAVVTVLQQLPRDLPVAVAVVLHRHKDSDLLLELLRRDSPLPVYEPMDKEPVLRGRVYLAPSDYHLLLEPSGFFALSVDEPVRFARPSVDVLFESAADVLGSSAVAVVLTGANRDGAEGALRIKSAGGRVLVQDPLTAEAPQMPNAVLATLHPDYILAPERMGPPLVELTAPPYAA